MNRTLNISLAFMMLLALASTGLFGCSTGATLKGQALEIQELNASIHDRAYRCAPHELAIAESSVDFGLYELSTGNFVRARDHIYRAEEHAKKADILSDFEECRDQSISVTVEKTKVEVAEIAPAPGDRDGDGIADDVDQCPDDPEDFDGFEDEDGCPDPDNDGDGVLDVDDQCPNIAGPAEFYGCPNNDRDFDGIPNINDQCPDQPEDFDGYQDEDGCPEDDNDGDGVPDLVDECPMVPGPASNNGCPVERKLVKVEDDQIKLNERVHFRTAKSDILASSYPLLNEVADVLNDNPKIHVRIEGHTDSRGKAAYNMKLSQERAASVMRYLLGRGIDPSRLESQGYGLTRPIEDNATETGRAANRRVEIHITKQ